MQPIPRSLFAPKQIGNPQGNDAPIFVTVHPSYLLRLPDEAAKRREYARFVEDLAAAKAAAGL